MAGIDKTYVHSYEQYKQVSDWCEGKYFRLKDGTVMRPSKFLWPDSEDFREMFEEHKNDPNFSFPIWNTPTYLDVWLIRNCPIDFIQERLKEQYGEEGFKEISEYKSEYDTFVRSGLGRKAKYKILRKSDIKWRTKGWFIDIEIPNDYVWYYEPNDAWYYYEELMPWTSNNVYMRNFNLKKLYRKIKKWNFPKGTIVTVQGRLIRQNYKILVTC